MSHGSKPVSTEGKLYETSDAHVRPLVVLLLILVISTVAVMWITKVTLVWYDDEVAETAPEVHPLADAQQKPAGPLLQTRTTPDLERYLQRQADWLGSYGWTDQNQQRCRVPIEQARKVMLERGFETTN